MTNLSYDKIDTEVLTALSRRPRPWYFFWVFLLAAGAFYMTVIWIYQVLTGMGVAGINHPVGWGVYIGNFIFWIGIAHSGTFISAILHLVRSRWRNAVSRASEAMTIFAILTAGLWPLIHLGRLWVFYYIIPYPSQRTIWPNFVSPLVLDLCAIFTYFNVSLIFFYVGLIPDLAAARDRFAQTLGLGHWRTRLYRVLALGWMGAASQWHHYGRAYLYFAALATPLVISVHSVVSWDFATSLMPGWHSTIFPPYFVAGAIHSGLAMVLTLVIPARRFLKLKNVIQPKHLQAVALTMQVTGMIVGYTYLIEPFMSWYSGNLFERQYSDWRMVRQWAPIFWMLPVLNVLVPLTFLFRKVRANITWLFVASILVNVGMWLERVHIVATGTMHDFLPHNWGWYTPTWVEWSITIGAFCWFLFWFVVFAKTLPVVPVSEYKDEVAEKQTRGMREPLPKDRGGRVLHRPHGVLAVFSSADALLRCLHKAREEKLDGIEVFSPVKIGNVDPVLGLPRGPVRYWTLIGALLGVAGGFWLAGGTASVNDLIVGGKPVISVVPFLVVSFEGMVLLGSYANLIGMIIHARLGPTRLPKAFDPRFTQDKFGLFVAATELEAVQAREVLAQTQPEELRDVF